MTNEQNRTAARTAAFDAAGPRATSYGIDLCISWLTGEESTFGQAGMLLLLAAADIDIAHARKFYTYMTRF